MLKVLVAEDDGETRDYIERGLRELGHAVTTAADGRDAMFLATGEPFDAIILDRMLPVLDGMTILRSIRSAGIATPVLMLTALARVEDRVEGLEAGADDYLVKPFAFTELTARLNALSRRPAAVAAETGCCARAMSRWTCSSAKCAAAGSVSTCRRASSRCSNNWSATPGGW